jgi:hypothetical protein
MVMAGDSGGLIARLNEERSEFEIAPVAALSAPVMVGDAFEACER